MKKLIFITGVACANLMLFGSLFKIFHLPGAGVMLTLATFLFCLFFLPAALANSYKGQEFPRYKGLYIITFIVFFINMMGTLFKIQHWPGAGLLLQIGLPLPFILFLPVYLYSTRNEKKNSNFFGVMFGLIFLAVFSALLSLNVSKNIINSANSHINMNLTSTHFLSLTGKSLNNKGEVIEKADELCNYIDDVKCQLLTQTGNKCPDQKDQINLPAELNKMDDSETSMKVLFGENSAFNVIDLQNKMDNFRTALLGSEVMNADFKQLSKKLLKENIADSNNNGGMDLFRSYQLVFVLDVLTRIQNNARFLESEYLTTLK